MRRESIVPMYVLHSAGSVVYLAAKSTVTPPEFRVRATSLLSTVTTLLGHGSVHVTGRVQTRVAPFKMLLKTVPSQVYGVTVTRRVVPLRVESAVHGKVKTRLAFHATMAEIPAVESVLVYSIRRRHFTGSMVKLHITNCYGASSERSGTATPWSEMGVTVVGASQSGSETLKVNDSAVVCVKWFAALTVVEVTAKVYSPANASFRVVVETSVSGSTTLLLTGIWMAKLVRSGCETQGTSSVGGTTV